MINEFSRRHVFAQVAATMGSSALVYSPAALAEPPHLPQTGGGLSPVAFGADPTGQQDSTAALQRWAARGGDLLLPADAQFKVTDSLTVNRSRTHIGGRGCLIAHTGLLGKPVLRIKADDCIIEGIFLNNPDRLQAADGRQSFGILIEGNRNQIRSCTINDFQMCLATSPDGEFYDNLFAFNHCRVIGSGSSGKGLGEDRGDGITDWGARAKIIGNTVEAAPGRSGPNDCRIGIHVEGLTTYAVQHENPDNAAASEIIGNVVISSPDGTGRFRRCYSIEGVSHVRVLGNYARGWTWDGIWLVGASDYSVVATNILKQDLRSANVAGAEWHPDRAGILVYATGGVAIRNVRIADNIIDLGEARNNGIQVHIANGISDGIVISGNSCVTTHKADVDCAGIVVIDAADVQVRGNRIKGPWTYGVKLLNNERVSVEGCSISGAMDFGLSAQASRVRVRMTQNAITDCGHGIESTGNTGAVIDGNHLGGIKGFGIAFAASDQSVVMGNVAEPGAGRIARFGRGLNVTLGNNVGLVA